MKDTRRLCFFRAPRRFFATSKPSERRSIGAGNPGQPGKSEYARAVLEMVRGFDEGTPRPNSNTYSYI